MEKETTKPVYSCIRTYKQRAEEILKQGVNWHTVKGLAILIDRETEYVCETCPQFNIKKGSPFTSLCLAVYDWVVSNYTAEDQDLENVQKVFSYIMLDPSNYTFITEPYNNTVLFKYQNISFSFSYCIIKENNETLTFSVLKKLLPMYSKDRRLWGSDKPYKYTFLDKDKNVIGGSSSLTHTTLEQNEIKSAPNFFTFVTDNENYCSIKLFPRQIQFGINLFEDYCPFCSDIEFAQHGMFDQNIDEIKKRITFYEFGKCPKCNKTRADAVNSMYYKNVNEINVCIGKKSAKTVFTAVAALYQLHRYLMLSPSPSEYFGTGKILKNQELQITFYGLEKQHAYDTIWRQFITIYNKSPWFINYEKHLNQLEDKNPGVWYFRLNDSPEDTYLKYPQKNITVTTSEVFLKNVRGYTNIFTACEEFSWLSKKVTPLTFRGTQIEGVSERLYKDSNNTLKTIRNAATRKKEKGFYDTPTAISCNISSYTGENDFLIKLIKEEKPNSLNYILASWEVNPDVTIKDCIIAEKDFDEFLQNYATYVPVVLQELKDFLVKICTGEEIQDSYQQQKNIIIELNKTLNRLYSFNKKKLETFPSEKELGTLYQAFSTAYKNPNTSATVTRN